MKNKLSATRGSDLSLRGVSLPLAEGSTPALAAPKPRRTVTPHGLRIAAIDIGTNSLHMIVVEVTDTLSFRTLSSDKDHTALGAEALVHHRLTARAIQHTLEALGRYQQIARGLDCDVILAYATSAVRETSNGKDFINAAKAKLNLSIQVISAREEAQLIYLAVRQAMDLGEPGEVIKGQSAASLIVDIGGGSCELIVGTTAAPLLLESFKLGASRLTEQFITTDPISKKEKTELSKHIRQTLAPAIAQIRAYSLHRVVGTSGTMDNLISMAAAKYPEEHARHRLSTQMSRSEFNQILKSVVELPIKDRRKLPGLDSARAPQIAAGAMVVDHLLESLDVQQIEGCNRALREGMIIDYMQHHWPKIKLSVQIRDPRRRSVLELARRCAFEEKHALQVTSLTLSLFDQLQQLHRMSPADRELLEFSTLLHDIGWHIGHSSHHKHSAYLIRNGDLEGFSSNELDVMANVARYHRKSPPKKSHGEFIALTPADRERVWKMAALLRIADGLDRGHESNVEKVSATADRKGPVTLTLTTRGDPDLELWGARHKVDMFEQLHERPIRFAARRAKRK